MRLFVGLDLPWTLRERLIVLANAGIAGARWVPSENYHLTLRFIGETPGHRAEEIDDALAGQVDLALGRADHLFKDRRELTARATPWRPEVDQHRLPLGFLDHVLDEALRRRFLDQIGRCLRRGSVALL